MPNDSLILKILDSIIHVSQKSKGIVYVENKQIPSTICGINKDYVLAISPYVIFSLGLVVSWYLLKAKLSAKLIQNEKFVYTWAHLICVQIRKQSDLLNDYVNNLSMSKKTQPNFSTADFHLEKVSTISSQEMLQMFVTNKKGDQQKNIEMLFLWEKTITFLKAKAIEQEDSFYIFKKILVDTDLEWNKVLGKISQSYFELLRINISDLSQSENQIIKNINLNYTEFEKLENLNYITVKEFLLDRLNQNINEFIRSDPKQIQAYTLRDNIHEAIGYFNSLEIHFAQYKALLLQYSSGLLEAELKIKKCTEYYKKLKWKNLFLLR